MNLQFQRVTRDFTANLVSRVMIFQIVQLVGDVPIAILSIRHNQANASGALFNKQYDKYDFLEESKGQSQSSI